MPYLDLPLSIEAMRFTPQNLVDICVSSVTAKVYPKILPMMAVFKFAHAFQVNKTTLTNLQVDLHLVFDIFGGKLNATSTVNGIYSDWKRHFNQHWHDFDNLTVLSFHNSAGNQITNNLTRQPSSPALHSGWELCLLLQPGCLLCGIKCTLDFTSREHMVRSPTPPILCVSYYFELPQSTCVMISGNGHAYTLVAYASPKDFRTLSPADV
jgi:hypothetical protein